MCSKRKNAAGGTSVTPPSSHSTSANVHSARTPDPIESQAAQETLRSQATTSVVASRPAVSCDSITRRAMPRTRIATPPAPGRAATSETHRSSDVTTRPVTFKRTASAEQRLDGTERYCLHFLNEEQFHAAVSRNNVQFPVDIVAVHGFNGHPYRSWTASTKDEQKLWLRDFLPRELPGARIFSFGYPAERGPNLAKGDIETFARSLLSDLKVERAGLDVRFNSTFSCLSSRQRDCADNLM